MREFISMKEERRRRKKEQYNNIGLRKSGNCNLMKLKTIVYKVRILFVYITWHVCIRI